MLHRVDVRELAFGLFLIALASVAFLSTRSLSIGTAAASCRAPSELNTPTFRLPLNFGSESRKACAASGAGIRSSAKRAMCE